MASAVLQGVMRCGLAALFGALVNKAVWRVELFIGLTRCSTCERVQQAGCDTRLHANVS